MIKIGPRDWWIVILLCSPLLLVFLFMALALFLTSCAPTQSQEPDFLGRWASDSGGVLVSMEFKADHGARLSMRSDTEIISEAIGKWIAKDSRLIVTHTQCQEGDPVRLVPCPDPDTLRTSDIAGDSWLVNLVDGTQIISFHFRRVY